jgi:ubiquinone/menaquinone biosynthesis C-methylase UbiE
MSSMTNLDRITGSDASTYAQRFDGESPDHIREAVWKHFGDSFHGVVLDIGSGNGGWIQYLKRSEKIDRFLSTDISDDGASQIAGVEFTLADASVALPYESNSLDAISALEVIEHLVNPRNFMKEVARCLKPGATAIVTTPSNESIRAKISFITRGYFPSFSDFEYHDNGHISPILEIDMRRMAQEVGLEVLELCYPNEGLIPKFTVSWQKFFPNLRGKKWSDNMVTYLKKTI